MKIVHITYKDTGGAAIAARRIHESLLEAGIDSNMLLLWNNTSRIKKSVALHDYTNGYSKFKFKTIGYSYARLLKLVPLHSDLYIRLNYFNSLYRVHEHPLVKEADIVHLHWVNRFLDLPTFFSKIKKPIIWTFHDMTPFTGGFPYESGIYRQLMQNYTKNWRRKKRLLSEANITGVATTESFLEKARSYGLFKANNLVKVPYPINTAIFKVKDKQQARKELGLPSDKKLILFVAVDVNNKRKGLSFILSQLAAFDDSVRFVVIGDGFEENKSLIKLGVVTEEQRMALAYAAADLFVTPAVEEAFGQTTLEALCCGVPVVSFPTAGAKELIVEGFNGVIVHEVEEVAFREGVLHALAVEFDRVAIAKHASAIFNNQSIAEKYIELYTSL